MNPVSTIMNYEEVPAQTEALATNALHSLLVGAPADFWCSGNDLGTSGWTPDARRLDRDCVDGLRCCASR